MTDQEIENIAVKHEVFGFGMADNRGYPTHGFDPEGLRGFVEELKALWKKDDARECAMRDLSYAHGMKDGWNRCILEDSIGYKKRTEELIVESLAALNRS